jgi:glutamine cyclotransferase
MSNTKWLLALLGIALLIGAGFGAWWALTMPDPCSLRAEFLARVGRPGPGAPTPVCTYRVVAEYPHDALAFTQGLVYRDGELYEGTGLRGESTLRRVDLTTGAVEQRIALDAQFFGEGVAVLGGDIFQLTWQEQTGFVYDLATFELKRTWSYGGEGWGLTDDGRQLIMSNGTASLYFWDPATLTVTNFLTVTDAAGPVVRLNELEYIRGYVYANIWQTDRIAKINPVTGVVEAYLDLSGLLPADLRTPNTDVLNGIAYDGANDRLLVTGKRWPRLYDIDVLPANVAPEAPPTAAGQEPTAAAPVVPPAGYPDPGLLPDAPAEGLPTEASGYPSP